VIVVKGKITAYILNIRKGPGTSYAKTGDVCKKNDVVNITGQQKNGSTIWYSIGPAQWISGKYVTIIQDTNNNEIVITPSMSITRIQEYLKKAGHTIRFTKGSYKITKQLKLYSDTTIILDKGAELIRYCTNPMLMTYVNPNVDYNFNATKNITIKGDGSLVGHGLKVTGTILTIFHSSNFRIEGIHFKGVYKSHAIDIAGSEKVHIKDVSFSGRIINLEKPVKEEIQYDFAYYSGIPYFLKNAKVYNGNHCRDIVIENCSFQDSNTCIGTHTETASNKKHTNICVKGCKAKGIGLVNGEGTFLTLINIDGAEIKDNEISNFARGIEINACSVFYDNSSRRIESLPKGKTGCKNIIIDGNTIRDAKGTFKASGVYISSRRDDIQHFNIVLRNHTSKLNNADAVYDVFSDHAELSITGQNDLKLKIKKK
jgi:hypothetical protein